jgi:hypothetical protein
LRTARKGRGSVSDVVDEPANPLLYFLLGGSVDDLATMATVNSTDLDRPAPASVRTTEH